jgi:hypothetical protein
VATKPLSRRKPSTATKSSPSMAGARRR